MHVFSGRETGEPRAYPGRHTAGDDAAGWDALEQLLDRRQGRLDRLRDRIRSLEDLARQQGQPPDS